MKFFPILFSVGISVGSSVALAVPEVARYGHFSCISCHVSPAGGGMLTSYGRDFGAEKLSSWYFDGEERTFAILPTSDRYLIGGDVRWVKYKYKSGETTLDKFWRMQTDLEAGVHVGSVWLTGRMGTRPAGPMTDPKEYSKLIHRGYSARVDLLDEHVIVRGGLFMPKFGLMLADHTAFVRVASGLGPDASQTQAEMIYQSDLFEVTVAGLVENKMYDREAYSKSGSNFGVSTFVFGKNRLNLNLLKTSQEVDTRKTLMTSMGLSGVVTLTNRIFGMFEIDRVSNSTKLDTFEINSEVLVNYFSLNIEAFKGFIPYGRYEFMDSDMSKLDTSTSRLGAGVNWYPRPHMQIEFRSLRSFVNANRSTVDESDAILHYYF